MLRVGNIKIELQAQAEEAALRSVLHKLRIREDQLLAWHVSKRSIDARDKSDVHFVFTLDLTVKDEKKVFSHLKPGIASLVSVRGFFNNNYIKSCVSHVDRRNGSGSAKSNNDSVIFCIP